MASLKVYVVVAGEVVKVGITADIDLRLRSLQTGCPWPLSLAWLSQDLPARKARAVERKAHTYLARHRTAGEWFALPAAEAVACLEYLIG